MPVHRQSPTRPGSKDEFDDLVADLAKELQNPQKIGQPIVLEDETLETNSLRVHVIWERWRDWSGELRSEAIVQAYKEAFPQRTKPQITLALGLTVPDAVATGLLPFRIVPARTRAQLPLTDEYRQVMLDAGATMSLGGDDPELRCATLEDAEVTIGHLEKDLPHSKWTITEQVTVYDE